MNGLREAMRPGRPNLIVRHWRGDCSLAVSYWINGLLAGAAVLLLGVILAVPLYASRLPWLYVLAVPLIWLFAAVSVVWQVVGVWRSAARTKRERHRYFWPVVAQIIMVVVALNAVRMIVFRATPEMRDAISYVRGDPQLGQHAVRILRGGQELEISGPLVWGLPQQLTAALHAAPQARVVHLDSIGGRIAMGLSVADIIRAHHLDTYVGHLCASACTLAFLAGQHRWIGPRGRLGFHSGIVAGRVSPIGNLMFRIDYGLDGLPPAFVDRVFRTSPQQIWYPAVPELFAAHIVTGTAPDGMFAVSGLGPHPDTAAAERDLLRLPLYMALKRTDPAWPELLRAWDHTVLAGEPITPFGVLARAHIAHALQIVLPVAPELALRQLAALLIEEAQVLQQDDPNLCWAYLHNGGIDLSKYFSPGLMASDLSITARVLTLATDQPQPPLSPQARRIGLLRLVLELRREGRDPARALAGLQAGADHAAFCPAWLILLRAGLAAPTDAGGSPLRTLFAGG